MKKLIVTIMSLILLLCFASCTKGGNIDDQSSKGDAMSTVESVVSSITNDMSSVTSNADSSSNNS